MYIALRKQIPMTFYPSSHPFLEAWGIRVAVNCSARRYSHSAPRTRLPFAVSLAVDASVSLKSRSMFSIIPLRNSFSKSGTVPTVQSAYGSHMKFHAPSRGRANTRAVTDFQRAFLILAPKTAIQRLRSPALAIPVASCRRRGVRPAQTEISRGGPVS